MAANAAPPVAAGAATQAPAQSAGGAADKALEFPAQEDPAALALLPATSARPKSKSKSSGGKKKKKKSKESAPRCVGYYLDALDKKMLWAEAKIIGCDVGKQKLRVHFIGWGKAHDIWTDTVSIAAHGRYAHKTKANNAMSWDGDMRLFEEMLGPIDASTPCHDRDVAAGGKGPAFVPMSVAPPPPPTPSQRRAAKAKALPPPATGVLPGALPAAVASPPLAASRESPATLSKRAKAKVAACPKPRGRPPAFASAAQLKATKPPISDEKGSRKRAKKSPEEPRPAPKKRREPSALLPEIAAVQVVRTSGGSAAADALATLEARRRQLALELELSVGFLERCAGVFKRQLAELVPS